MLPRPSSCASCPLDSLAQGYAPADGTGTNGVLLLGEALGEDEAREGRPFVGRAGRQLLRILRVLEGQAGIGVLARRDAFRIDNTVRCRPPGNVLTGAWYHDGAIASCRQHNTPSFEAAKCTVALGKTATSRLDLPIDLQEADADPKQTIRGYVLPGEAGWAISTFHPAYLMRGLQALSGIVADDIRRAIEVARDGFAYDPEHYILDPAPADFRAWVDTALVNNEAWISYDIETPYSRKVDKSDDDVEDPSYTILRASFSFREHEGVTVPWQQPYIDDVKRLLAGPNVKVSWNGTYYDIPRLRAHDVPLGGKHFDGQIAWQFLQPGLSQLKKDKESGDLKRTTVANVKPNRLAFVAPSYCRTAPWKHLADASPAYYSAKDGAIEWQMGQGLMADLKRKGQWDAFWNDTVEVITVLEGVSRNGVPVDAEAQQVLKTTLEAQQADVAYRLQSLVPAAVKPRKKYKTTPKELRCAQCKGKGQIKEAYLEGKRRRIKMAQCGACAGQGLVSEIPEYWERREVGWARILPFNPGAPAQVKKYIRFRGHKMPSDKRTGKDTAAGEELRRLARDCRDQVYNLIVDFKDAQTLTSRYIWPLAGDGRVHTSFGFTATGRLRSFKPNMQNVPKRKEIAESLRRTIVAPPGYVLLEADWSAIEAVLTGYFANDPEYLRVAQLGVHTYMAGIDLGRRIDLSLDDAALRPIFKQIKADAKEVRLASGENLYEKNKRGVHGSNYMMTPNLLQATYPELFLTRNDATSWQVTYFEDIARRVKQWHKTIATQISKTHYLLNPFCYGLWFWDVYKKYTNWEEKEWEWAGEDVKAAVAFLPQSTAAGVMRQTLLRMRDLVFSGHLILPVHDSFWFLARPSEIGELIQRIVADMTRQWSELGGLSVGIELYLGENMAEMEEIEVPAVRTEEAA